MLSRLQHGNAVSKVRRRAATTALAVALLQPAAASACTASAFVERWGGPSTGAVGWNGNAVGCHRTWTYSWRLRLYRNGDVIGEDIREGLGGSTSYTTPSHIQWWIAPGQRICTRFFIYHSRTVGQNRVDEDEDCLTY